MGYDKATVECDSGEHGGYTDTGEIEDGGEVCCEACYEALKERIKELEGELESVKGELESAQVTVQSLEQQLTDAQN